MSASSPAKVLTSEKRFDLRKNVTNFSDCRETRRSRRNFAKMITQETKEKSRRIPRTTLAVVPVSPKKDRIEGLPGRFSEVTG